MITKDEAWNMINDNKIQRLGRWGVFGIFLIISFLVYKHSPIVAILFIILNITLVIDEIRYIKMIKNGKM